MGLYVQQHESGPPCAHRYEGEWANGRKEGKGVLILASGDSFTGYWSEGAISGPGMLTLTVRPLHS